jgi:hypothetical protein
MLDNYGYRHTLRMCNAYCFSKAAMVTRTRLSVMFMCMLSVLSLSVVLAVPKKILGIGQQQVEIW